MFSNEVAYASSSIFLIAIILSPVCGGMDFLAKHYLSFDPGRLSLWIQLPQYLGALSGIMGHALLLTGRNDVPKSSDLPSCVISDSLNADIAGQGVLAASLLPAALTALSLLLGSWCTRGIATRELGFAHLINLSAITINLIKAFANFDDYHFLEIIIILSYVDILSACLSMVLSDKHAMRSRVHISISAFVQLTAIVAALISILKLGQRSAGAKCCYRFAWWGPVSSCELLPLSTRLYLILRCVQSIYTHVLAWTFKDLMRGRRTMDLFDHLPVSAASKWTEFPVILLAMMVHLGLLIHSLHLQTGRLNEWGQSVPFFTAAASTCHWVYVLLKVLFNDFHQSPFTLRWSMIKRNFTRDYTGSEDHRIDMFRKRFWGPARRFSRPTAGSEERMPPAWLSSRQADRQDIQHDQQLDEISGHQWLQGISDPVLRGAVEDFVNSRPP